MTAQREQDIDPFLGGAGTQLGEPHPLGLRERPGTPRGAVNWLGLRTGMLPLSALETKQA
ncbi:MAG: hypothetical protein ABSA53_11330 [Streptosporangiaceae bacterium]